MSTPRNTFNTLPARPEYLTKVLKVLSDGCELSEKGIVLISGLTKTQTLCALIELVKTGKVMKIESSKTYKLA